MAQFSGSWLTQNLTQFSVSFFVTGKSAAQSEFEAIETDSRKVSSPTLFACIVGEKQNAHAFISTAFQNGGRGFLVSETVETIRERLGGEAEKILSEAFFIHVRDTEAALGALSFAHRRRFSIPVVAIGGSVGKTTTKSILACLLKDRPTLVTEGSLNGHLGLSITLLKLRSSHERAVIEIGIDEPGTMEQHVKRVAPTHALLTAIGPEHLEKLKDVATVLAEEWKLLDGVLETGGQAYFPTSDEALVRKAKDYAQNKNLHAVTAKNLSPNLQPEFDCAVDERSVGRFQSALPGSHHVMNTALAIALARALGTGVEDIRQHLAEYSPQNFRTDFRVTPAGVHVLLDMYNSNPQSLRAGLELFLKWVAEKRTLEKKARAIAILGDMLELGPEEKKYHEAVAEQIDWTRLDQLILIGPRMQWLAEKLGPAKKSVTWFCSSEQPDFWQTLKPEPTDLVFFKGSRGMKLERLWEPLNAWKPSA